MDVKTHDFRLGKVILSARPEWTEFQDVVESISMEDILDAHHAIGREKEGNLPAGGQSAINRLFKERLVPLGWEPEPRLFSSTDKDLAGWKMDFIKSRIGVEVSFNHAEAIPWTFTRLNIAGESDEVVDEHRVDVGIAIFATRALKQWSRMDGAVGTFERATMWLNYMKPILPIPIFVIGLDAEGWPSTEEFRGTQRKGSA